MTQAVCFKCGESKFGAFTLCQQCQTRPLSEADLIASLCLTDHYLPLDNLQLIGEQIKSGQPIQFESEHLEKIAVEVQKLLESPMGKMLIGNAPLATQKKWWKFWT